VTRDFDHHFYIILQVKVVSHLAEYFSI